MADAAHELAAAIRAVVHDAVLAALRSQSQSQSPTQTQSPSDSPKPLEERRTEWKVERMLYPLNEVQQRLGVGRSTLYQLLGGGQLLSVKIGHRRFVTATALDAYVQALSRG
ncbi:helix-turn-helix domain-containing protein [Mycolicibacterium sp. Dal123E01]|uniref:helix-turn-helix domain-containing protein n=1 Tax=Mycolicibacterium sp. Dal123E01 TaxID=3457578 RepID=UPI00403E8049